MKKKLLAGMIAVSLMFGIVEMTNAQSLIQGEVVGDVSTGMATGIFGFSIDAPDFIESFDVTFEACSFDTYPLEDWYFIGDQAGALEVSQAINQLLTDGGWTSVIPDANGIDTNYMIPYEEVFIDTTGTYHVYLYGGDYMSNYNAWWNSSGQNMIQYQRVYARFTPNEICNDGIDNDGDRKTDCRDRDCKQDPACQGGGGGNPEICDDGIDNDGDGKTDCADKKDCRTDPAC